MQIVTLPLSSVQHAELQLNKNSRASPKLPRWLDQVIEVALWLQPGTHHQCQSLSRLYKRSEVSTAQTNLFLSEVADLVPGTLRKMPRLSEPGPACELSTGTTFENKLETATVCTCCRTHSSGCSPAFSTAESQIWSSHATRQTHWWTQATPHDVLLPQAGSQVTHGGQEGISGTMIKTIQYLAEADSSRGLLALDLKAAFQNVSRGAMLHSIEQSDLDLARCLFPNGTLEPQSTECTTNLRTQRSVPTVGLIRDVLSQLVASLLSLILFLVSCWLTSAGNFDPGAKLFAYLDDWYWWV